jgi:hypothetical protein
MKVRDRVFRLAGGSGVGDEVALSDARPLADVQCAEMREGRLVAVARHDRDGQAVRRNLPGERHLTRHGRANRARVAQCDVDTPMLAGGVRVVAD